MFSDLHASTWGLSKLLRTIFCCCNDFSEKLTSCITFSGFLWIQPSEAWSCSCVLFCSFCLHWMVSSASRFLFVLLNFLLNFGKSARNVVCVIISVQSIKVKQTHEPSSNYSKFLLINRAHVFRIMFTLKRVKRAHRYIIFLSKNKAGTLTSLWWTGNNRKEGRVRALAHTCLKNSVNNIYVSSL